MPDDVADNPDSAPRGGFGSELFWRLIGTVIFFSVLWILWLLWQITPSSTVNPIVFQMQQNRQSASGLTQGTPAGAPLNNLKIETELKLPPKPAPSAAKK